MQHSDLEFNLCWVFDQLTKLDTDSDAASRKRTTSHSSDAGAGGAGGGGGGGGGGHGLSLNLSHLRRVFGFLGVQLSDDELEEVLNMLDDDMDGRVTQQDFMHALQVHRDTPFDSRYAVNLPWSALDSSTKDGALSEEDSRVARETFGRMWGSDNEAEFNASVRAAHALQAQPERSVLSVHSDSTGSLPTSPAHYSSGGGGNSGGGLSVRSRSNMYMDREGFRRIVSALAEQPPETVSPMAHARTVQAPSFTQQMLHASAAAAAAAASGTTGTGAAAGVLDASMGLGFTPGPSAPVSPAQAYGTLAAVPSASHGLLAQTESGGLAQLAASGSSRSALSELHAQSPTTSFSTVVSAVTAAAAAAPLLPHAPSTARPGVSRKSSSVLPPAGSQSSTARGRRLMGATKPS